MRNQEYTNARAVSSADPRHDDRLRRSPRHNTALAIVIAAIVSGGLIGFQALANGVEAKVVISPSGIAIGGEAYPHLYREERYCWYDTAWRGPGWYRCGYAWRDHLGWGGPFGWHHWHRGRPGNFHGGHHHGIGPHNNTPASDKPPAGRPPAGTPNPGPRGLSGGLPGGGKGRTPQFAN
ncbi:MAG TPA: hypothetical protein VHX61_12635 [Rhizomicrobium sp.]|jgi:hypothetical protein|nr:hypothetical protein [Rhizomicrobium sp.]